jgi:predicted dehydrogenase
MKQVLRKGLRDIVVEEVPDPAIRPHHVLVRPLYSLISAGTETASIHQEGVLKEVADNPGHLRKVYEVMKVAGPVRTLAEVRAKFSEYAVLGYSGAGVVVEIGTGVAGIAVGDVVAYGGEGTGHGETVLAGRNLVAKVPANVGCDRACFATLGCIALNAVRIAAPSVGEVVAVIGQGLVGQLISQLARLQGAVVVAIDLKPERIELARALGADYGLLADAAQQQVLALTNGRGVDCAIVAAAAKNSAPARQALELARDRGRIVVVGAVDMEFPWLEMYLKEVELRMARAYGPGSYDPLYEQKGQDYPLSYVRWTENRNMEEFLRLVASGRIDVERLVTHRFSLDQAPEAYRTILDPASESLAVLLRYPAADQSDPVASYRPQRKVQISAPTPRRPGSGELRVALVGAGNLARWAHLPNLKKTPGVKLQAVYSGSGARGKTYGSRFGAAYVTSDYQQILEDRDIDLVLIASRNQDHAAQALAALESGKHAFVEKPMALTREESEALRGAVANTGLQLTVGFNRRFAPFYIELKKRLKGRTGPAVLNCRVNSPGISGTYWMADPAIGGAILGEACHFVDLLYWLLESEPLEVTAFSLPTGRQEPIGENNLVASFRFADGSIANLTYCTVGSRTSGGERVEGFAQGIGVLTENFKKLGIHTIVRRSRSRWWADKGYAAQLAEFLEGIRKGRPPAVTVEDGARATIGCLCLLESARAGGARIKLAGS